MYQKYFEKLEKKIEKKDCCENKELSLIDNFYVCINCAIVHNNDDYEKLDNGKFFNTFNPKFQVSTKIEYKNKYKKLYRLQKWNNYNYKENTLQESFRDIKKIGKKYNITIKLLDEACKIYNNIYMKENISSRNKIKKCIYIFCIYQTLFNNNCTNDINIFNVLKDYKLSINNFNSCLIKLDINLFFLHEDMEKFIKITKENYKIDININYLIELYNQNLIKLKNNNIKINKTSLLIYIFYKLIKEENIKNFINLFSISRMTLTKIINKMELFNNI